MSTVNIVMASYNGEKYIREQIDSILASTYTDWSLTVFDDCSTDKTVSIVKEYASRFPERIFFYKSDVNKGSTRTFLEGLMKLYAHEEKSSSNKPSYFMFADQDDIWLKDKIEKTLDIMHANERKYGKDTPLLVYTDAVVVDKNLRFKKNSFHGMTHLNCKKNDLAHLMMENKCMGCTCMMNAPLVQLVEKIPDDIRLHDWWMVLLAATFGRVCSSSWQSMLYRQHGNNQVGSSSFSGYCSDRLHNPISQRNALKKNYLQANTLLKTYGVRIPADKRELIQKFCSIEGRGFFGRRILVIRKGFLKSGCVRNIGLLLII